MKEWNQDQVLKNFSGIFGKYRGQRDRFDSFAHLWGHVQASKRRTGTWTCSFGIYLVKTIVSQRAARILRQLDVLLVDDNKVLLTAATKILKSLGVPGIKTANDGEAALALLKTWPANLVITDLNMLPMNGLVLTQKIRSGHNGIDPRIPVIALTGNADPKSVKAALLSGVNGFMVNPVEPDTMVRRIEKVIATKVIYREKQGQFSACSKATGKNPGEIVYDGILPRASQQVPKSVESSPNSGDEDDMWVLD